MHIAQGHAHCNLDRVRVYVVGALPRATSHRLRNSGGLWLSSGAHQYPCLTAHTNALTAHTNAGHHYFRTTEARMSAALRGRRHRGQTGWVACEHCAQRQSESCPARLEWTCLVTQSTQKRWLQPKVTKRRGSEPALFKQMAHSTSASSSSSPQASVQTSIGMRPMGPSTNPGPSTGPGPSIGVGSIGMGSSEGAALAGGAALVEGTGYRVQGAALAEGAERVGLVEDEPGLVEGGERLMVEGGARLEEGPSEEVGTRQGEIPASAVSVAMRTATWSEALPSAASFASVA